MSEDREKAIESLVSDCFIAHQETIIAKLIYKLEQEYIELAKLVTLGEYDRTWTHKELLDFITFN